MTGYCPAGLPHSEIPGSKPVCGSPRLIAAYRVLRRLSAPRHPPCTLSSLTKLEHSFPGESYRFLPDSVVKELENRHAFHGAPIPWKLDRETEESGQRIDLVAASPFTRCIAALGFRTASASERR